MTEQDGDDDGSYQTDDGSGSETESDDGGNATLSEHARGFQAEGANFIRNGTYNAPVEVVQPKRDRVNDHDGDETVPRSPKRARRVAGDAVPPPKRRGDAGSDRGRRVKRQRRRKVRPQGQILSEPRDSFQYRSEQAIDDTGAATVRTPRSRSSSPMTRPTSK